VNFLLDTNIVSEWMKSRPNAGVVNWLAEADEDRIFISAVTIAEIRYGVERLPQGVRRDRLDAWLTDDLPLRFEGRVLAIDANVGNCWGRVMARGRAAGRPVAAMDAFIAATTERYDLVLATRNVSDFEVLGIRLINPWGDGLA
jgi:predicted nucleic acid-binding protein